MSSSGKVIKTLVGGLPAVIKGADTTVFNPSGTLVKMVESLFVKNLKDKERLMREGAIRLSGLPAQKEKAIADIYKRAANPELKALKQTKRAIKASVNYSKHNGDEVRAAYNETEHAIAQMNKNGSFNSEHGNDPEKEAKCMHFLREFLKVDCARKHMTNQEAVQGLRVRNLVNYGSENGPTFDQALKKIRDDNPGISAKNAFRMVVKKAEKTSAQYNADYGFLHKPKFFSKHGDDRKKCHRPPYQGGQMR